MGPVGSGPTSILDQCRDIDNEISAIERNLAQLQHLQSQSLGDATGSGPASRQLDDLSSDTMALYRALTPRIRALKSDPAASQPRNAAQVNRVDKRLKDAIQSYQSVEANFQRGIRDQLARQYRIVRPDADDAEVADAVQDTRGEVFQRALMQSGRQGQATAALGAVRDRHDQILKIERQMAELAQLFADMNAIVVQQEPVVQQIEQHGEQAVDNISAGVKHADQAVEKARAARKKKWICLGICGEFYIFFSHSLSILDGFTQGPCPNGSVRTATDSLRLVLIVIIVIVVVLAVLGGKLKLSPSSP